MKLQQAIAKADAYQDAVIYRLAKPDILISWNSFTLKFYHYKVIDNCDLTHVKYKGKYSLNLADVLANDWQVRVEPFVVEEG